MYIRFCVLICFVLTSSVSIAKDYERLPKKGQIYLYWGYNRAHFSTSDLHFTGPNYDLTFYDLTASDRPTAFGIEYFTPGGFFIPQYNYRAGYFLTDNIAISFGMDHMKYVIDQDQPTTVSGIVNESASHKYAGVYFHEPTLLTNDKLMFEHTDGFNFFTLDFEYLTHLYTYKKYKLSAYWNGGLGGVWVVTKTDVKVFGDGLDNDFHVAGWTLTGKTGPRLEYNNKIFTSFEARAGYASLPFVLIKNASEEVGDHNVYFVEYYWVIGVNFRLGKKKV